MFRLRQFTPQNALQNALLRVPVASEEEAAVRWGAKQTFFFEDPVANPSATNYQLTGGKGDKPPAGVDQWVEVNRETNTLPMYYITTGRAELIAAGPSVTYLMVDPPKSQIIYDVVDLIKSITFRTPKGQRVTFEFAHLGIPDW